eukprot:906440-Pyramimonas_sp.AAC.1
MGLGRSTSRLEKRCAAGSTWRTSRTRTLAVFGRGRVIAAPLAPPSCPMNSPACGGTHAT